MNKVLCYVGKWKHYFFLLPLIIDYHFPESILERLAAIGAEIREKASQKDRDIPNEFHEGGNTASFIFLFFKYPYSSFPIAEYWYLQ